MRIKGLYLTIGLRGEPVNRPQLRFLLNLIDACFFSGQVCLKDSWVRCARNGCGVSRTGGLRSSEG